MGMAMMRDLLIFVLSVCACHVSWAAMDSQYSRVEFQILYPRNHSIVGNSIEVHFQLDFFDASNMRVNPPYNEYLLDVTADGEKAPTMSSATLWSSIGYGPLEGSGLKTIDFTITVVNKFPSAIQQQVVLSDSLIVNLIPNEFAEVKRVLSLPEALSVSAAAASGRKTDMSEVSDNQMLCDIIVSMLPHHRPLATSVALALDDRSLGYSMIAKLSPQSLEFFDWSSFGGASKEQPHLNFAAVHSSWHAVQPSSPAVFRAYYDVSISVFTADTQPNHEKLVAMAKYLAIMRSRTSGHFVVITTLQLLEQLVDTAEAVLGSAAFLTDDIQQQLTFGSNRAVVVYFRSVEAAVVGSAVTYDQFSDRPKARVLPGVVKTGVGNKPTLDVSNRRGAAAEEPLRSTVSYMDAQNGINYLSIGNGCVDQRGKLVLLTTEAEMDLPVLGGLDLAGLNTFMDRSGFMPFTSVNQAVATRDDPRFLFLNATAALVKPFYALNIFHHFQSLAGLLSLREVLPPSVAALRYLLMPNYNPTSDNQYEWNNALLSLVTQMYEKQGAPAGSGRGGQSTDELLSVLFEGHFKSIFASKSLMCFRELIVVGEVDANRGFFANASVLSQFREAAYRAYAPEPAASAVPSTAAAKTPPAAVLERVSLKNAVFHKKNDYKLKVAFSLRLHNRRILNLPALHAALIASGVVDMHWLDHLTSSAAEAASSAATDYSGEALFSISSGWTYLDNMIFQDQVKIFKEIDLFVGVHGSAFINAALFMQPHSVCIALMQSRHMEFILPQIIHQAGIQFLFLPVTDQRQSSNCSPYPAECLTGSLTRAGGMDCLGIRNCDVEVSADWFQSLVEQAAHHVRANKRLEGWAV